MNLKPLSDRVVVRRVDSESVTKGGSQIIPIDQIINTTKASFAAIESLRNGTWINI